MSVDPVITIQKFYKAHGSSPRFVSLFRQEIYSHYKQSGRTLPWRTKPTPYQVLVSEIMLQQTQVDRVIPKYLEWMKAFPTIKRLAAAPLPKVFSVWSGLGYNRRARFLWLSAQQIARAGFPATVAELEQLPGIGPATARSIAAFGFNQPEVFIETNIRSVYIYFFFPHSHNVSDQQLLPLIEKTLDTKHPRRWYSALMDYGTALKRETTNPSRQSKHYTKQSTFAGSARQLRGKIMRELLAGAQTKRQLIKQADQKRVGLILDQLVREKLIEYRAGRYRISHA